jgi:hypothetical protein
MLWVVKIGQMTEEDAQMEEEMSGYPTILRDHKAHFSSS